MSGEENYLDSDVEMESNQNEDEDFETVQTSRASEMETSSPLSSSQTNEDYSVDSSTNSPQRQWEDDAPNDLGLISDQVETEVAGREEFRRNYVQHYEKPVTVFFDGSLQDAVSAANGKTPEERKLLVIYLHDESKHNKRVFIDTVFSNENDVKILLENCVVYGWDITAQSNLYFLISLVLASVSEAVSTAIARLESTDLPAIVFVGKLNATMEVLRVIRGRTHHLDTTDRLIGVIQLYNEILQTELKEIKKRLERENFKREQDLAYQSALEADQAKEAAKKLKEIEVENEKKRLKEEEFEREIKRQEAESSLPEEPKDKNDLNVVEVRIRKYDGGILERKFFLNNTVQDLLNFVVSKGYPMENYKVIRWPGDDLTTVDTNLSFNDLKMYPKEMLLLQERS